MTPISQVAFRKPTCDNPPLTETIERFDVVILGVDMGFIAPKERKHLSADALFGFVRSLFANVPDHRSDDTDITVTDALMAGFAMFSLKCPSLLDFDKQRADGNWKTIYGIERAPCDSYVREMLDPVAPESLRPLCKGGFRQLQRGKALEEMVFFKGCYLLALDGTGYFASKTMHCQSCLEKHHRDGSITYAHQLLGAALMHPDRREVIPLMPEAIIKHDGGEKNDCERNAAKRFMTKLRHDHPHLGFIITEDGLSSNAPHIETLHDYGCHSIPTVSIGVTCAVVCTYGCNDGRIVPTRCAIIDAGLDGR